MSTQPCRGCGICAAAHQEKKHVTTFTPPTPGGTEKKTFAQKRKPLMVSHWHLNLLQAFDVAIYLNIWHVNAPHVWMLLDEQTQRREITCRSLGIIRKFLHRFSTTVICYQSRVHTSVPPAATPSPPLIMATGSVNINVSCSSICPAFTSTSGQRLVAVQSAVSRVCFCCVVKCTVHAGMVFFFSSSMCVCLWVYVCVHPQSGIVTLPPLSNGISDSSLKPGNLVSPVCPRQQQQ